MPCFSFSPSKRLEDPSKAVLIGAGVVLICLTLSASWHLSDADGLSRLAIGQLIARTGSIPQTDPFTFSRPALYWCNPEWLGDLIWYGAYHVGGEPALVVLKIGLITIGWWLALAWATRAGASPWVTLALMALLLPAVSGANQCAQLPPCLLANSVACAAPSTSARIRVEEMEGLAGFITRNPLAQPPQFVCCGLAYRRVFCPRCMGRPVQRGFCWASVACAGCIDRCLACFYLDQPTRRPRLQSVDRPPRSARNVSTAHLGMATARRWRLPPAVTSPYWANFSR